jgi:hypothetical protein
MCQQPEELRPDPTAARDCGKLAPVWRISERLFLGDYKSGEQALAGARKPVDPDGTAAPFAGVVSMCPMPLLSDEPVAGPSYPQTEWLKIPIVDGGGGEGELESALMVARPFVARRRQHGNVLVHCAAGMSRSVALVAGLLCDEGETVERALDRISLAKAEALYPFVGDPADLVCPAWEFRACLSRLYGRQQNHARRDNT